MNALTYLSAKANQQFACDEYLSAAIDRNCGNMEYAIESQKAAAAYSLKARIALGIEAA